MRGHRLAVLALGLLAAGAGMPAIGVLVLATDVGASVGATGADVAAIVLTQSLALALAAWAVAQRTRRVLLATLLAAAAAIGAAGAAFAGSTWELFALLTLNAAASGAAVALHPALLADRMGIPALARGIGWHRAFGTAGVALALALTALLADVLSWRGVVLVLAGLTGAGLLGSVALRDRGRPDAGDVGLSAAEVARGLVRAASVRRLLAAHAALGVTTVPLLLFALQFFEDRWSLGLSERAAVLAACFAIAAVVPALLAREGERLLAAGPDQLLRPAALVLSIAAMMLAIAVASPTFGGAVGVLCAAFTGIAVAQAAMSAVLMSVVDPAARGVAAALAGCATAAVGGVLGLLVAVGVAADVGIGPALVALALPASAAALALRGAADAAAGDLAMTRARIAEEAAAGADRAAGLHTPLIACHGLVVRYGHRRAVDGVDLAVDDGELVALLGTNGAGKSTLLRAMSGLTAPDAGSVRLEGLDITLLDTERRYRLGIGHVAAGAAVFESLSVHESLRLAARAAELRRRAATDAIAWAFERFPRLHDRRTSRVGALSGGERQMLALAQMLLSPPRVLLADELSLGLAPGVVAELLDVVREIHAEGTTVVVVEQSVDRALQIATRAVFLERGRVRFDGAPAELLQRDDLLRPVFLTGADVTGGAR